MIFSFRPEVVMAAVETPQKLGANTGSVHCDRVTPPGSSIYLAGRFGCSILCLQWSF